MKSVAEAKAEARRALEAKQKEVLLPYIPKNKIVEESVTIQVKKRREFMKLCLKSLPKQFNIEQKSQFCNGKIRIHVDMYMYVYMYVYMCMYIVRSSIVYA